VTAVVSGDIVNAPAVDAAITWGGLLSS
jgi:hypothetical protein